jgi:hypothetical protein
MPFPKLTLDVRTRDGRNVALLESLEYLTDGGERIVVPAGFESDGASTPQTIWNLFPPFGPYWLAAILHDWLYRRTQRPKAECDSLLKEAMRSLGVDLVTRDTIYEGVHLCGQSSFDEDRRALALSLAE